MSEGKDYVAIATAYAEAVVAGNVPACIYVKQACQRQLDDLKRTDWRWHFDDDRASHICRFIELLPHIKGKWARAKRTIDLEPWQCFQLTTVFGWVDEHGLRRFKTVYEEVPRKNAKSTKASGVGLYTEVADGEEGAEVYSAATTRDQAAIVWRDAKRMVDRSPGMRARFGVECSTNSIHVEETASWFRPLSRDQGGNHDGLNIQCAIVDELHAHKTRDIWDVIETGTGAREQPLIWAVTTAGFNRSGICYEQRSYAIKVLSGVERDDEYFAIIYTVDQEDLEDEERLLSDPALWAKANPNWGVSVNPDDIARKARKALSMASARNNFLTKHLNVWVNADVQWMSMAHWDRCAEPGLRVEDFAGRRAWIALDLASKLDIADAAILVEDGNRIVEFHRHYLPEDAAEEGRNSQYSGWAREGWLTLTPGNITDYGYIEDDLLELARMLDVQEVIYDPFQATYLATRLQDAGLTLVEYGQTVKNMSEPMKEYEARVLAGTWCHNGDPVQTWMISNVVCHTDAKDNIYPRKEQPENKIDGPVATMMGLGRMLAHRVDTQAPGIEVW